MDNPSEFIEKRNKELMAQVNLCQTRLSHVPEHFSTLPECKSKPGYEGASVVIPKNWITKRQTRFAKSFKETST